MTFGQAEQRCKDKGATLPIMERYSYGEDMAEFLGLPVNSHRTIWLGKQI